MKFKLSGAFGELSEVREGVHNGIDLAIPADTTLRSVSNGIVEAIRDYGNQNIGKGVVIRSEDGNAHIYGHMNSISVEPGQHISAGDILGATGSTGHAHGAHLHFGIQTPGGEFVDPTQYAEPLSNMAGSFDFVKEIDGKTYYDVLGFFKDKGAVNKYSDTAGEQGNWFLEWMQQGLQDLLLNMWHWFIANLPDIMGYSAILAAICIILGSMFGKGGMMKPLAIFAGMLILATLILGGV